MPCSTGVNFPMRRFNSILFKNSDTGKLLQNTREFARDMASGLQREYQCYIRYTCSVCQFVQVRYSPVQKALKEYHCRCCKDRQVWMPYNSCLSSLIPYGRHDKAGIDQLTDLNRVYVQSRFGLKIATVSLRVAN